MTIYHDTDKYTLCVHLHTCTDLAHLYCFFSYSANPKLNVIRQNGSELLLQFLSYFTTKKNIILIITLNKSLILVVYVAF